MVILTSFPPPTWGIHCQQPNTKAFIQQKCFGDGTLYIAEERLSWVGTSGEGFSLEYPGISLHAVSRDLSSFPAECLYLMIDQNIADDDGNESSSSDDSQTAPMSIVRFVPEDKGTLDAMYGAMNECQLLHPDENEDDDDDEFYGEDGDTNNVHLSNQGHRTLNHLENIFTAAGDSVIPDGHSHIPEGDMIEDDHMEEDHVDEQFEDAD